MELRRLVDERSALAALVTPDTFDVLRIQTYPGG